MARLEYAPAVSVVLGGLLLAASLLWAHLIDPKSNWSERQAEERAEAGMEFHSLSDQLGHVQDNAEKQRVQALVNAAKERYRQADAGFGDAQRRYQRPTFLLRRSGLLCLLLGIVGYGVLRLAGV